MPSLHLYQRPAQGTTYVMDLTRYAWPTWRRSIRALGGFWTGEFTIQAGTMSRHQLWNFYHNHIGRLIKEITYGRVTWEGEIYEMVIHMDGSSDRITLDPDYWHNKVKVQYMYPRTEDINQGALAYNPGATTNTFQDAGQDFSDWETAAPGTALFEITITNADDSTVRGYIGDAVTVTSANDSFEIYTDVELTEAGYQGETSGKTPSSYTVSSVANAGVAQETAWDETTDSSDLYGECEFIDVRGEMYQAAAEGIRSRRLTEHAYPRSVPTGGLTSDEAGERGGASLDVLVAGYAFSMNRRHMESDVVEADADTQIGVLVDGSADAAEFVTAGTIDANSGVTPSITCAELSMRLWDLCEEITEMGDGSGARWISGVYEGRVLNYQAAETTVRFGWRNNRLVDDGGIPVYPTLIRPDIIIQRDTPWGITPGSGNAWDNPRQFYVEEVEFVAPRSYRLIPYEGEEMVGEY